MAVNTAPIKWAQRSDSLYLTIALPGRSFVVEENDVGLSIFILRFDSVSDKQK